ncbi:MAG: large conductance mechanosensitive channel protein MscL [Verrucomicrobiota bacterium]|nr:large conductance mechanosensitive channel protein MscL [Verrucomicrobiota bacterium]
MIQEFKAFAMRGNAVDLAVGVIIGAAFGKIVTALVNDIIMPPIGKLIGNLDFTNLYLPMAERVVRAQAVYAEAHHGLKLPLEEAQKAGPVFAWGDFVTVTLNFLIVAFCVFLLVKGINELKRLEAAKLPPPAPPAPPSPEEKLLTEIRDLLKNRP